MIRKETIVILSVIALSILFVAISALVYLTCGKVPFLIARKLRIGATLIMFTNVLSGCGHKTEEVPTCYDPAPDGGFPSGTDEDAGAAADTDTDGDADSDTDSDSDSDSDSDADSDADSDTDGDSDTNTAIDASVDTETEIECYAPPISHSEDEIDIMGAEPGGEIELSLFTDNVLQGRIAKRTGDDFCFRIIDNGGDTLQAGTIEARDGAYDESLEEFEISVPALPPGKHNLYLYCTDLVFVNAYDTWPTREYLLNVNDHSEDD